MRPYVKSICQLSLMILLGMVLGYLICDDLWRAAAAQMLAQERAWSTASGGGAYALDPRTGQIVFEYRAAANQQAHHKLVQGTPAYVALSDVVDWANPTKEVKPEELRRRLHAMQSSRFKYHSANYGELPPLPDMR